MREIKFRRWDNLSASMILEENYIPENYGPNDYIMQYTGLKDINGVEIYEFDYVEYKGNLYKVIFNKFKISLEEISKKDIIDLTDEILSDLSIKGNVYEN